MSSSIKITSLLALASTVAAVPHYSHGKFHSSKVVPTGGWAGAYNATAAAGPTGTGAYGNGKTTTLDTTSTSTETLYSTVYVKPSSSAAGVVGAEAVSSAAECGGTVTVTASEVVTVTVTPGGATGVAASSPAVVASSPAAAASSPAAVASSPAAVESTADYGYGASSASPAVSKTPAAETSPSAAAAYSAVTPEAVETPAAETTTSAAGYSAVTPEASSAAYSAPSQVAYVVSSAAASSTSASASATASSTSTGSYSGAKRGLAFNQADLCSSFSSGSFGFSYNWGQTVSGDVSAMFIPMMHTPSDSTAEDWLANVKTAVSGGSTAVMGFNECDQASQCNLEPDAACTAWKSYMNPIKTSYPDVTIIGPSISNGQAPEGLDWLTRFKSACSDAEIDATNIHFYDDYDSSVLDRFQAQVDSAYELYGMKVWITEFGLNTGTATDDEAASFLKEAMSYMDGSDKVQGYSWFMVGTGEYQLNTATGLSAIGEVYASSS